MGCETLEGDIAEGGSIHEKESKRGLVHKRFPVPNLNAIDPILSSPKGASREDAKRKALSAERTETTDSGQRTTDSRSSIPGSGSDVSSR